jgi:uncharacterized membrane protein YcaP (DUF421 family)
MMDWLEHFHNFIGRDEEPLSLFQMLVRAVVLFMVGVALVRIGAPRIFSRAAPVDIVLAVIIGSNLSRTLTGNAPFIEVIIVTAALVALHGVLARLAVHCAPLSRLIKGRAHILARDGDVDWKKMRICAVGKRDLLAAVRQAGGESLADIHLATLERGGEIDVILCDGDPPGAASKAPIAT